MSSRFLWATRALLFIGLLSASLVSAQDRFTNADFKIISRDLEVTSFLIKLGQQVESRESHPLSDAAWAKDLSEASMEFMKKAFAEGPDERRIIEKFRSVIKWESLWEKTKSIAKDVKAFGRYRGLAAAVILVATAPSDIYNPIILTALGKPEWIPVVVAIPITFMALGANELARNRYSHQRIQKAMGGRAAYQEFLASQKQVLKELRADSNTYLHSLTSLDGELQAIMISEVSTYKKILSKLGFQSNKLTYPAVLRFCEETGVIDDVSIKSIMARTDAPEHVRAGMILQLLQDYGDPNVVRKFEIHFKPYMFGIRMDEGQDALWDLYKKLVDAKNVNEVRAALQEASSFVRPKDLAMLWKEKLIPEWSKNMDEVSHFEFRRLVKGFDEVYGTLLAPGYTDTLDDAIKLQFFKYLDKIGPPEEICRDALRSL